jgi:hypothetical protein
VTIICVKDGVVAADGSSWLADVLLQIDARKIVRSIDGALGGSAGNTSETAIFRRWFATTSSLDERSALRPKDDPLVLDDKSGFAAMWLEPDGEVWQMDYDGRPYSVGREAQALGVAWRFALGAMCAGLSAEQAVRLCIERHGGVGGEVFVERLAPVEEPSVECQPAGETVAWDQTERDARAAAQKANEEWRERMGLA